MVLIYQNSKFEVSCHLTLKRGEKGGSMLIKCVGSAYKWCNMIMPGIDGVWLPTKSVLLIHVYD